MQILAVDTSTESCSVALWKDGIIHVHFEKCPRKHDKYILPLIKKILDENTTTLEKLDAIAFSRGPGSFTGVRIGIGISQGIALGVGIPVIGISTLAIIAQGAWRNTGANKILVAIDARIKEVYWAEYILDKKNVWHGEKSEKSLKLEEVDKRLKKLSGEWTKAGTGWKNLLEIVDVDHIFLHESGVLLPTAEDMLPIAYQLLLDGKAISADKAEPIYLLNGIT